MFPIITSKLISNNKKIKRIVRLLKFILTIDDKEVIKSTIETIIEMLEEN